jgi:hypothetical protein
LTWPGRYPANPVKAQVRPEITAELAVTPA